MSSTNKKTLSHREKLLLPMALAVISIVLYATLRLRPGLMQLEKLKKELSSAVQGRETLSWPSQSSADATILQKDVQRLATIKQSEMGRLAANENRLADLSTSSELQRLRIQISELARQHDIKVLKNLPYKTDSDHSDASRLSLKLSDAPKEPSQTEAPIIHEFFQLVYARPLQHLELSATYSGLQRFIQSLGRLEHNVNVVSFEIKTDENPDELTQPRLSSQLVLAL